jgi:hypothetical protein
MEEELCYNTTAGENVNDSHHKQKREVSNIQWVLLYYVAQHISYSCCKV